MNVLDGTASEYYTNRVTIITIIEKANLVIVIRLRAGRIVRDTD